MRYVGRIIEWNDERGFGFVTPEGGGDRAFVHVKEFRRGSPRPVVGTAISYEILIDNQGRFNAAQPCFVTRTVRDKPGPRLQEVCQERESPHSS